MFVSPTKSGPLLASFTWLEAANCCPELFAQAWKDLADAYAGPNAGVLIPIITEIRIYQNGIASAVHSAFFAKSRKVNDSSAENEIEGHPFGRGPAAAAAAKEYVERKQREVGEWKKKWPRPLSRELREIADQMFERGTPRTKKKSDR